MLFQDAGSAFWPEWQSSAHFLGHDENHQGHAEPAGDRKCCAGVIGPAVVECNCQPELCAVAAPIRLVREIYEFVSAGSVAQKLFKCAFANHHSRQRCGAGQFIIGEHAMERKNNDAVAANPALCQGQNAAGAKQTSPEQLAFCPGLRSCKEICLHAVVAKWRVCPYGGTPTLPPAGER